MSTPSNVHVSTHPCVRAKLSLLRSASTNAKLVESLIHEIATIVGSEALANSLEVQASGTDKSPLGYTYPTHSIPTSISLIPILRSGLSMVSALQSLLPQPVPVHHLGLYREKSTLQPVEYYNNLPYHSSSSKTASAASSSSAGGPSEVAIIVDPIIATGQTVCAAIETLREWGVKRIIAISVLASEQGLRTAGEAGKDGVEFWVGGVDAEMDENGMIKPGLGDVGDRLFGTGGS